jgi:hypothetical protein
MKCKKYREQIILFMYGELSDSEQTELEQHVQTCSACTADLEYTRKVFSRIEEADPVEIPEAGWDKVWNRIESGIHPYQRPRAGWIPIPRWVPVTAGLVAILAAGIFIGRYLPSTPQPAALQASQAPDFSSINLENHFENLKPVLAEYANRSSGEMSDEEVLIDRNIIHSLLVQNYMLMRLVAQNDPDAADLLEDIDLVLREIKNIENTDPDAAGMIQQLIRQRDILFKIDVLQKL